MKLVAILFTIIAVVSMLMGNPLVASSAVLFCLSAIVPLFLRKKLNVFIHRGIYLTIILFSLVAIGLGEYANFYEKYSWFDGILHFISAVLFGFLGGIPLLVLVQEERLEIPSKLLVLFAFCVACTLGLFWEFFEFITDLLTRSNMQPSLSDTMHDLLLAAGGGLIGAILGYVIIRKTYRRKEKPANISEEMLAGTVEKNTD